MSKQKRNIVYSTDPDWKKRDNIEDDDANFNVRQSVVYIRRETKGRGGKTVTIVKGLVGDLRAWKKELQKVCGAGGTVKSPEIEIQGDQRERIARFLSAKGIKSKFSGG